MPMNTKMKNPTMKMMMTTVTAAMRTQVVWAGLMLGSCVKWPALGHCFAKLSKAPTKRKVLSPQVR